MLYSLARKLATTTVECLRRAVTSLFRRWKQQRSQSNAHLAALGHEVLQEGVEQLEPVALLDLRAQLLTGIRLRTLRIRLLTNSSGASTSSSAPTTALAATRVNTVDRL